ncbi:MAG TPA: M14 family zinc carboxypeptidase [Dokdonella sp.]|uniref:M14 family zinc carboxypeptidase n=1 Tax=Dokdonella sp. TaxID=2291710 RepID=UPI002CCD9E98|nr:M14 family zinc carboxypeptidase [Dokdonella sp.]HUD41802.1 M14 family zinc carboxypeptidase [Dokdonella sp.]
MIRPCTLALALLAAGGSPLVRAADWFVEAQFDDRAVVDRLGARFQHLQIDPARRLIRVDTDEAGIAALSDAGLEVRVDMVATAKMRAFHTAVEAADTPQSIPGYACYRTVEETAGSLDALVAAHPALATIETIGPTWERERNPGAGYEMRALRVTNLATAADDPDRPRMVMYGSIHAREYTPAELLMRMAEGLVAGYGHDPLSTWLVDHVDFRFIVHANPDGRKRAETGIGWRKNTNVEDAFCPGTPSSFSQPGVDLNRNFPFHWSGTGGSSTERCDQTFRGPSAGSEPETRNLLAYTVGTCDGSGNCSGGALPDRRGESLADPAPEDYSGLFFDVHSFSQLVLWPWGDVDTATSNDAPLRRMGRRLAWFNGYWPMQSVELYPTRGTTVDTVYGYVGAAAFTIELGVDFFESCNEFENATLPHNLSALLYAARAARRPYQWPQGPDARDLTVDVVRVAAGTAVTLRATIDDTRYNQDNGAETSYAVTGAQAYVDVPPWRSGAVAIAAQAGDGSFDATSETVQVTIPTAGLAPGKHLVWIQGVNARNGGTAGTPDAVFIEIIGEDRLFADGFEAR